VPAANKMQTSYAPALAIIFSRTTTRSKTDGKTATNEIRYTFRTVDLLHHLDTEVRDQVSHSILIWLVPFLWIMIIKTITKPTLGSDKYDKTKQAPDYKDNQFF